MYIQTHVLSGWCLGNLVKLSPRERVLCMMAASLPDIDGIGIVVSQEHFWAWHHVLGHSLCFGILLSALLTAFSHHRRRGFLLYLVLFHLHLFLDYYGSGPGWGLAYLWPWSSWHLMHPQPLAFEAWQNIIAGYASVAWTVGIAVVQQRTPLECLMPSLDRQLVALIQKWTTTSSGGYRPIE